MLISIAIPCYRSSETLPFVVKEIKDAFGSRPEHDYQIILVNDYPYDTTFEVIKKMCAEDRRITGVNLSKNYGQVAAKLAAVPYFKGDVLVYMDDDGQHPAEGVFALVDKINEGYDLVYAHFSNKKHNLFKRLTSRINSKIQEINKAKPKGLFTSSFMALSKTAALSLKDYKSPFPSIGGYLEQVVNNSANVEIEHRSRIAGRSNYTLGKMLKLWFNVFTSFSVVPLHFASVIGAILAFVGFAYGVFIVIRKLVNPAIAAGFTSIIALLLLIGGLIIIILGLIGEYTGRIYMTVSDMPQYTVREAVNTDTEE